MKIITNNQPRLLLDWDQLTPKEQRGYGETEAPASFVRYHGRVYNLSEEFMYTNEEGWDGIIADSAFSGVLVRFVPGDSDRVIMGSWYS